MSAKYLREEDAHGAQFTPNLRRLAEQAAFFPNVYATGTRTVCGIEALTIAGLKNSDGNMTKPACKFSTFDLGRDMCEQFEKWSGTCTCAKLRGTDGKTDRLRSRRGCVADCARITEDFLFKGEFEPCEERRADEE